MSTERTPLVALSPAQAENGDGSHGEPEPSDAPAAHKNALGTFNG